MLIGRFKNEAEDEIINNACKSSVFANAGSNIGGKQLFKSDIYCTTKEITIDKARTKEQQTFAKKEIAEKA